MINSSLKFPSYVDLPTCLYQCKEKVTVETDSYMHISVAANNKQ